MNIQKSIFAICLSAGIFNASAQIDRSTPPEAKDAPKINIGKAHVMEFQDGLRVFVVENHKMPRVSYQISIDRPPVNEGNMAGMLDLFGAVMKSGTAEMTKDEINEAIDFIGASLFVSSTGVYGSSLTKHSDKLLDLIEAIVFSPTFPEEELEREKKQAIAGLEGSKNDPNFIASNVGSVLNYGKNHPYGEVQTVETISNITVDALKAYYKKYFKPAYATIVVVGDITPGEVGNRLAGHFGEWYGKEREPSSLKRVMPVQATDVSFVDKPGAVQSVIKITYPVYLKPGSEDAIAAKVMNEILGGGGFSARLMQNLREDKAYTYGAYSSLNADKYVGSFSASASVRNEVTDSAIVQFLYEMKRITEEPVAQEKLDLIKNKLAGAFARSLESPQTVAGFALNIKKHNLPEDYYETYLEKLSKITVEDVQRVAKKYIKPDQAHILVVGNKGDVYEKLKALSPTKEVTIYDVFGEEAKALEPVPSGVTAQDVLDNYLLAITGQKKVKKAKKILKKISSIQIEMDMEIAGAPMKMSMSSLKEKDGKFARAITANGQVFQKTVLKDGVAKQSGMMGSKGIDGDELENLKKEAVIMPETYYADSKKTFMLLGIQDGLYKMEITDESGDKSYEFYDVETGLKMKSMMSMSSPDGETTIISEIDAYDTFEGIKFPTKTNQSVGPQSFKMTTTKVILNEDIDDKEFE